MDTMDWGLLIAGLTLLATIIIGILQLFKKSEATKEKTIKSTGKGDAVNGHKSGRDVYGGDTVYGDKYGGDNVHGNKEVHYHNDKKEK